MLGLWRSTPIKFFRRKYSSPPQTWNVLFFGSDNVSLPSLQRLHTSKDLVKKLEVVVTEKPGKSVKEGAEVARYCQEHQIPCHEWAEVENATKGFDIGVVASFGKFIPPKVINSFPYNMINMHPSLLPRGAAPILHSIRNGDPETGVCIIDLHPTCWDKGQIYSRTVVPISEDDTLLTLTPRLADIGAEQLSAQKQPQPEISPEDAHKARAPKIQPAEYSANWQGHTNVEVYNHWRSMPNKSHTYFAEQQLKITRMTIPKEFPRSIKEMEFEFMKQRNEPNLPLDGRDLPDATLGSTPDSTVAGRIVFHKPLKTLFVRCLQGWVAITELFVPTMHKPLSPAEFINNYQVKKIPEPKFSE